MRQRIDEAVVVAVEGDEDRRCLTTATAEHQSETELSRCKHLCRLRQDDVPDSAEEVIVIADQFEIVEVREAKHAHVESLPRLRPEHADIPQLRNPGDLLKTGTHPFD